MPTFSRGCTVFASRHSSHPPLFAATAAACSSIVVTSTRGYAFGSTPFASRTWDCAANKPMHLLSIVAGGKRNAIIDREHARHPFAASDLGRIVKRYNGQGTRRITPQYAHDCRTIENRILIAQ